ncbi:DUF1990 family protein [Tsukamurella sp. 1534]|uniref:DUF1990 family protein n=1 Tax=Tsukamurella sp. 1534 TaxID=1151061 RepID=UPI000316FFB6|nr:DUF1990 domain-containing protein [Tsukamurella sp. 1534]
MTHPAQAAWGAGPAGYRRSEVSAVIGHGEDTFRRAAAALLRWGVKTASGFAVAPEGAVRPGLRVTVTARVAGVTVTEPVQVVDVVDTPERAGFSYRTLPGHPVRGEEAFVVHRDGDDVVLTVRSLTRAAPRGFWRAGFPALLVAQRVARRRYLRSLR